MVEAVDDAVVLCTRNRPVEVARCLESLAEQVQLAPSVVVVDSSDDAATRHVVELAAADWPDGSRLEHVPSRPALTHQRRVGIARTRGQLVHFVDDDVELDAGYLAAVRAAFAAHDDVVGVGGFVINQPDWRVKRIDRLLLLDSTREGCVLRSGRNVPVRTAPDVPLDVTWLSGCAMSYRRQVLEVEPPDESFPFEGEDVELSFRVARHGRLLVLPDARVVHHESDENRVRGVAQVDAELMTRYRRVVSQRDRLSTTAFWLSAYGQLAKFAVSGTVTFSRRRLDIARGTARAMTKLRAFRTPDPADESGDD